MRLTWKDLWQERHDAYESDYKIIIDRFPFRTGKTLTPMLYCLENNINSIITYDNHKILRELYGQLHNLIPAKIRKIMINILIGKGHPNSDEMQRVFRVPPYLCLALNDPNNLTKTKNNYMLESFCSDICKYQLYNSCPYKTHMRSYFKEIELYPDVSSMWLAPKSYLNTGILNAIVDKIDNTFYLNDEDLFNQLYKQVTFETGSVHDFMKFITFISTRYKAFKGFRVLVVEWLEFMYNILVVNVDTRINKKLRLISEYLENILESWKVEDIKNDNELFKELAGNHMNHVRNTYNLIPSLIKILEDVNDNEDFRKQIAIDKKAYNFSYFINSIDKIKELMEEFYKIVITDSNYIPNFIETTFPKYIDNYKIIGEDNREQIGRKFFKMVYILHKDWANNTRNYGTYPKYDLWSYYGGYDERFNMLTDLSNQAIEHEAQAGNTLGLLISHKKFIRKIKEINKPIIREFGVDMKYNWYKNTKGLMYPNRNYGVILSSFNIPLWTRKIINQMYGIAMEDLEWQFGPGEYLQGAGRLQDPDRKMNDLPNLYVLTNAWVGYFDNEINFEGFTEIKYKHIINYLTKRGWVRTNEIMELIKRSDKKTKNILEELLREGFIKWKKGESISKGRPPDLWHIK